MELSPLDWNWITVFGFACVSLSVVIAGIRFLKLRAAGGTSDPLNPSLNERLGFSLTLGGITLTMSSLILIIMKLAKS